MSERSERADDVPAEDWAEQLQEADPSRDEDETELATEQPRLGSAEVDEADLAEQQAEVFVDDEDA
jgi:hypothetical protein